MAGSLFGVLLFALGLAVAVLVLIFVLVPILKGLGSLIVWLFRGIGFLIAHVFRFIGGMISDTLRFVGSLIAVILLAPMSLLNLVIGRWSAAGHFADSVRREFKVGGLCLYRVLLGHPLKFLFLSRLLEGVEERVPEAMAAAPTADRPRKRVGQFPGYTIVGSLRGGGSGAKLYIARPDHSVLARYPGMPERVVIKAFALSEGSTLPQILRESRALECAKQLGLVFEHGMDEKRFFYVMPYHAGDHLGIVTRQLHGETDGRGLGRRQLATALGHVGDLVSTLSAYHRGGLWHKDVKPENVIIDEGRAHLVDLGLVTPLRSAMTLTTHGTEYFRDPELVRQAIRGVKVHQIDGAKFDIYAVGAVLYFLVENTFPAHGALSRFERNSPDALRWIIRRAMADYTHRYATADEMLADLRHVAQSSDFFAVRPADLPSMAAAGDALADFGVEEEPVEATIAGSPVPPPLPRPAAPAAVAAAGAARPKLEVTNWWTGAYRVVDGGAVAVGVDAPAGGHESAAARAQARALRHQSVDLRNQVRAGAITARRAAREQVKMARRRAREIRAQSRAHRLGRRAVAERQPSFTLVAIGGAAILGVAVLVAGIVISNRAQTRVAAAAGATSGAPLLLLVDDADADSGRVQRAVQDVVDKYDDTYDVVIDDRLVNGGFRELVSEWVRTRSRDDRRHREIDTALELSLQEHDLYGLLVVGGAFDPGMDGRFIPSSLDGAARRRYARVPEAPPVDLPYLLVNDHPTKYDPGVEQQVRTLLDRYGEAGWTIIENTELEALVRASLPPGRVDAGLPVPATLKPTLAHAKLGGVLYISGPSGDGAEGDAVTVNEIDMDQDESDEEREPETPREVKQG